MGPVWTIVVAGGGGSRFGALKQFSTLGGRRLIDWGLDAARAVSDGVVAVVPASAAGQPIAGADRVVPGGETRSASVRAGLAVVPMNCAVVVVHDAARPFASAPLFRSVVDAVISGADGAIPGIEVADTLKRSLPSAEGLPLVTETVNRDAIYAVQTPQAFRASVLRAAHAGGAVGTDDAQLIEAMGAQVVIVPGEVSNLKVTTPEDLEVASALLQSVMATRS